MNIVIKETKNMIKPSAARNLSFASSRNAIPQNCVRDSRINSCNPSKRARPAQKLSLELSSTKDPTPLTIISALTCAAHTEKNARPFTAGSANKPRIISFRGTERSSAARQNPFGPTVKKIHTPLSFRSSLSPSRTSSDILQPDSSVKGVHNYLIGRELGKGAYASVRYALHKPTNRKVAIKIYEKHKFVDQTRLKNVHREIEILQQLNSSLILKLYESIETDSHIYLITELISGQSLKDYLRKQPERRLSESEACRIFYQLIQALDYCHSNNITHRDIKLDNILLDQSNNLKLIDFGFSTFSPPDQKSKIFCGTPSYMAPEILLKLDYLGPPVDLWASGVILYGILSGSFPFKSRTDKDCYRKILKGLNGVPAIIQQEPKEIIEETLVTEADKRMTAKQILNHRWFKKDFSRVAHLSILYDDQMVKDSALEQLKKLGYSEEYIKSQLVDVKSHIFLLYQKIKKHCKAFRRNFSNVN